MRQVNPSVLVGIVSHNRGAILRRAIRSAISQDVPNLRIAVLDDGSTDDTPTLQSEFPSVDWIRWPESRGYMAARNFWMANAPEEFFVSLDDDAWFLEGDEIVIACRVMDSNPQIAAIAFDILSPDKPAPRSRVAPQQAGSFIGCGHMLRLSAVRVVGGYEQVPGSYGVEEKDLCLRLLDAGYEVVLLPGVHVWHDKTILQRDVPQQHRSGVCNDLVMTFRRTSAWLLPLALMSKFYRHLRFSVAHRLTRSCFEGFALFFKSLPGLWRTRRPVKTATLRTFMRLRSQ
jgi:GT2 family glycosyltransferase